METSNRVLDAVLKDLAIPHIEDRLPRDFFYQLGLRFPQQYGIACRDVAACVRRAEAHGAGPFLHAQIAAPNWIERGKQIKGCKLEVALGYAGDVQVEFLGPGQGTEHYSRALVDTDIAFHHVGIYQNAMPEIVPELERHGFGEVVRGGVQLGRALSIDFRYFDAREAHGLYIEVLDFRLLGRELDFSTLIRAYSRLMRGLRG